MTKIAAIQMCSTEKVDENLEKAATFIQQAVHQGAGLVVLPDDEIVSDTDGIIFCDIDLYDLYQKRKSTPVHDHIKKLKFSNFLS